MANVFLKTLESPWLCNIHGECRPPPFLIYAQFWWLLVVFSHTHSQYISKVWQYDLSMVKWRKKWFTSKWTSKIKLIQQTRGRPMLWCHPKIQRLSTPIIKPPSGVHLTVLGLQVVATTFEGSAQGFQTHLLWRFQRPLIVQTSDANDVKPTSLIFHPKSSCILDYKYLGSYVYTQNKQNTYIIYTCIYIHYVILCRHLIFFAPWTS